MRRRKRERRSAFREGVRRLLHRATVATAAVALASLTFVASIDLVIRPDRGTEGCRAHAAPPASPDCNYCYVFDFDTFRYGVGNSIQPEGYLSYTDCFQGCFQAFADQQTAPSVTPTTTSSSSGSADEWDINETVIAVGFVISIFNPGTAIFVAIYALITEGPCGIFNMVNDIVGLWNDIDFSIWEVCDDCVPDVPNFTDILNLFPVGDIGLGTLIDNICNPTDDADGDGVEDQPPTNAYCADGYGSQITDATIAAQCCNDPPGYQTTPNPWPKAGCPLGTPGAVDLPEIAASISQNTDEINSLVASAEALEGAEEADVEAGEGVPPALAVGKEATGGDFANSRKKTGAAGEGGDDGSVDPKTGRRRKAGPAGGVGDFLGSLFGGDSMGTGGPTGPGSGTGGKGGAVEDSTYRSGGAAGPGGGGGGDGAGLPGGGSTVETWGVTGPTGEMGEVNPMGDEEPEDYFGMAGDESLFKRVERRYKKRSGDWHQEDLDAERERVRKLRLRKR